MDDETKAAVRLLILAVLAGTNAIRSTECKWLSQDPNPEWFNYYEGFAVKMHTSPSREGISGMKVMYKSAEYSFFNRGYGQAAVGPRKAVNEYANSFAGWTDCLTWEQARLFMAKMLADSKEKNPLNSGK